MARLIDSVSIHASEINTAYRRETIHDGDCVRDDLDLSGVWAARLELRFKSTAPEFAEGFRGAFTTILVRCETAEEFIATASQHVAGEGFEIVGLETLYPLTHGQFEINKTLAELVELTREYPIQWTTFHLFKSDA